jgi:transcriptional regulator GlxA family with amidase domain
MLMTSIERTQSVSAAALVRDARVALDSDLEAARECLRMLEAMLDPLPACHDMSGCEPLQHAQPFRGGLAAWQLRAIKTHVDRNLERTISIAELARLVRLSGGHFCRAFKASMGETAHTYVTRRRIEHAQMLMVTTNDTLSAISNACGLADQAHLTRLFRRFVAQTPLAWRKTWGQAA